MPATYSIKLTFSAPDIALFNGRNTYRLMVTASEAVGLPNEIFLHQKTLVDQDEAVSQDEFVAISSPFDMSTYPANVPSGVQSPAYFRKDQIDILLPGITVFEEVRDEIQSQVQVLLRLFDKLDDLLDESVVLEGTSVTPDSSSSSSL